MIGDLTKAQISHLLRTEYIARIGCHDGNRTYVVPICYAFHDGCLYAHSGLGMKTRQTQLESCDSAIELLNPNARIKELLEDLGVLHLFKVRHGQPEAAKMEAHEPLNSDKEEVRRACQEAHQTLMEVNKENVSKFKDVARFLIENVKNK